MLATCLGEVGEPSMQVAPIRLSELPSRPFPNAVASGGPLCRTAASEETHIRGYYPEPGQKLATQKRKWQFRQQIKAGTTPLDSKQNFLLGRFGSCDFSLSWRGGGHRSVRGYFWRVRVGPGGPGAYETLGIG